MGTEVYLEDLVIKAVKNEVEKTVMVAVEKAKAELELRIPEIVAGVALRVEKHISFERRGTDLCIHLSMGGGK